MSTAEDVPVWRDAWRAFQDPYLGPNTRKFPSPFESFVAGFLAARTAALEEAAGAVSEWEYGNQSLSGEIVAATSERWALKHFESAGVPVYRRSISPGPWFPITPTGQENKP